MECDQRAVLHAQGAQSGAIDLEAVGTAVRGLAGPGEDRTAPL